MFKFENVAVVGERIRAYDFYERTDCYVEGTVKVKDSTGAENPWGLACYVVVVDVDGWRGERMTGGRVGITIYVPMEVAFMEWAGRVVKVDQLPAVT